MTWTSGSIDTAPLDKHQNPINCRGVKYLRETTDLGTLGLGSVMFHFSRSLAHALNSGRVLIPGTNHHPLILNNSWECSPSQSFECLSEKYSSCEPQAGDDVLDAGGSFSQPYGADLFTELLQCSPVKQSHYLYWFRAQATAFLMRPNTRTRQAMDDFRSKATLWRSAGGRSPNGPSEAVNFESVSAASLAPGTIAVLARASDKLTYGRESEVYDVSKYIHVAEALASGNQSLPVRGHLNQSGPACTAGPTFRFLETSFAKRRLFFGTEDSRVFGAVARGAAPGWEVSALDESRTHLGVREQYLEHQLKHGHAIMIQLLVALEVILECDAWVFTFSSGWARLVDTLRATVGRHAFAPALSLSWGVRSHDNRRKKDSIGCPENCEACYLACGGCKPC
jgi:hypothetical protein